jgi:transposase
MSRPRRIDAKVVARAQAVAAKTRDRDELRAAQSILLPALMGATLEQTATVLGVGRATVHRLQTRFRKGTGGWSPRERGWGGRRYALMTVEEEKAFLSPWLKQAGDGGVVVVSPLRAALAQQMGHPIAASVVYRLLARHGWRKVAPDTRHPKNDPVVQEEWKKNFRRSWRPF